MNLSSFLRNLTGNYNTDPNSDQVRVLTDWLVTWEDLYLEKLLAYCIANCKFFPKIIDLKDHVAKQSRAHYNPLGRLSKMPVEGLKLTKANIEKYGYIYHHSHRGFDLPMRLSRLTTEQALEYIENGEITEAMQRNQLLLLMIQQDNHTRGAVVKAAK